MPSFNKENFKNFQSNYNRTQTTPIIHSTFHCVKEYPESQILVNQKYNIVVKYLEETDNNNNNKSLLNINKKRELFNNTEACSSTTNNNNNNNQEINAESDNESKSFKKLRSSSPNIDSRNISTAAAAATSNEASSYFIEIDES